MLSIREISGSCQELHPHPLPAPAAQQLSLPSGPGAVLRGGRRERSDEDRDYMARAFSVRAGGLAATAVYRCLAYHCSKTERRVAYPAQATVAEYCEITVRHVRRVLRKLESDGLIVCTVRKKGAQQSHYILTGESRRGHDVPFEADMRSANKEIEGREEELKTLLSDGAQNLDLIDPKKEGFVLSIFPSKETKELISKEQAPEPIFKHPKQIALLFALQRKLNYRADDGQAAIFDGLEHTGKKRILDALLVEEQVASVRGEVAAPPKAAPSPRHEAVHPVAKNTMRVRPTCSEHIWTQPASDGVSNCLDCDAETGGLS